MCVPGASTGGPFGNNRAIHSDGLAAPESGQVGTQLSRDGDRNEVRHCKGFTSTEVNDADGLEKLEPLTQGRRIDVAALRSRAWDAGGEIGMADARAALARLWMNDDRFSAGKPGRGPEVARSAAEKDLRPTGVGPVP